MQPDKDTIYNKAQGKPAAFEFDDKVARVFEDMIRRSVPGYAMTLSQTSLMAKRYARGGTNCYDLGCSLGAGMVALDNGIATKDITLVGVDNSTAMLQRCEQALQAADIQSNYQLIEQNIQETPMENASIVLLNFTLQFIPKNQRLALMQKIYASLNPGGVLLLSEKIHFEDSTIQSEITDLHHDFKKANGYSDLEISQKRAAIEDVLIPETIDDHKKRLKETGFQAIEVWLQCFNFVSFLAIK
ncbi:carboxy-S-adenosyl-L-methionine synthase CmoA [Puniceicoccaceae bacterium K14]|nr:carboxy-S-adenosyl-L-methionine synthase CmoA [Puniceicoccaceae bacterium K14]